MIATKPDVVISFIDLTNVMVLLATRGLGLPVIVSERIDPHHHAIGRVGTALRRLTYPKADRVVVQTTRAARYFAAIPAARLITLANPVPPACHQASQIAPEATDAGASSASGGWIARKASIC